MADRRRLASLGLAAIITAAGGTAWAIAQDGDSQPAAGLSRPTEVLERGTIPDGDSYEVARIDPAERGLSPAESFCTQIRTPAAAAQSCNLVPDADGRIAGQPWRPSLAVLGTSRFFTTLAPEGVTAMEVQVEGEPKARTSRSIDAGPAGELLIVVFGGPMVTSRDPASSLNYEVRLRDAKGETVQQITMSDSVG
jgi:hypothetical protein